ncbi:unnamed protein product [Enterobius vermicularis]|uniref:ZM domain-containing protein n=1 Tax=Enterobius vermicularis TaxID=51028 RepID=A0A0N4VLB9_ENTVE|nr:unnamed protein product [Enterobius vermicularis]
MRSDKKKRYSPPNSLRVAPQRQWQPTGQTATTTPYTNLYTSRATPSEYVAPQSPLVNPPPSIIQAQPPMNSPRELGVDPTYRPEQTHYYQERLIAEPIQTTQHTWQTTVSTPTPVTTVVGYVQNLPQTPPVPTYHTSSV